MKTDVQIAKNRDPEVRKAKDKPELKKLTSERIQAMQTAQKTTHQEKSWVEDGPGKEREKVALRRKEPYIRESNHTK